MPIDYKKYPKNWKEIREKILRRDINFDTTDNRMCNFIALCQRCHIKLDAGEKARKREIKKNNGNKLF